MSIEAFLDDYPIRLQQAELERKNKEIARVTEENEMRIEQSFKQARTAMRAGYMMISGMTQVMGGSMSQAFTAMYGVITSGIQTYGAIATAAEALGMGTLNAWMVAQAAVAIVSLITAGVGLAGIMVNMDKFTKTLNGITMILQGWGGMVDSFSL